MLLSGVRSSCDMLARNSDLYFEVSASSSALSSSARRACSISWFLRSTSTFCSASCCAFCASCSLVCCSSFCCVCSSPASCCDCLSRPSVCIVASMELRTMPMLAVSCSRKARWVGENSCSEARPSTALIWPSKMTGKTTTLRGSAWKNTEPTGTVSGGHVGDQHAPLVARALADEAFAELQALPDSRARRRRRSWPASRARGRLIRRPSGR